ncbi:unnamed protein product [Cylindrotheca closterium]|uniref:Uncharacterized protein n=1 Tax=Cylindrotheca closterium TaxID=2856 RepID=A0AAD2FNB1_9STRA|nr:unnamed protein product [Cylindrotheca closterium]
MGDANTSPIEVDANAETRSAYLVRSVHALLIRNSQAELNARAPASNEQCPSALAQFMGTLTINYQSCVLIVDNPGAVSFQEKIPQQGIPSKGDQEIGVKKTTLD